MPTVTIAMTDAGCTRSSDILRPCESSSAGSKKLAAKLVSKILRYLPIPSLRQAAGVSRQFYACAWKAGLYIHRRISWGHPKSCYDELAAFEALVQHALPKKLRLGLSFSWSASLMEDALAMMAKHSYPPMRDIADAIVSAAPLLVYLSISISNIAHMTAPFYSPMPRLEHLVIWCAPARYTPQFPLSMFLSTAWMPSLRKLELGNATIGVPLPAFAKVTILRYTYDDVLPEQSFADNFPKLAHLSLASNANVDPDSALRTNLQGVSLRSLDVEGGISFRAIRRSVSQLDDIPVVRLTCDEFGWLEPAKDDADFSLRLSDRIDEEENAQLSVIVVPAHRRWRRVYHVGLWTPGTTLPLAEKPGGMAHLSYLRLDNTFMREFLSCNAVFPALKGIHVDFWSDSGAELGLVDVEADAEVNDTPEQKSAPTFDNSESPYNVPCPALAEVTLFAVDNSVTVQSREVASLGRALGQLTGPQLDKARLALVGVEFAIPEAGALLGLTFSAVTRCAFSGRHSTKDHDAGLWEEMD